MTTPTDHLIRFFKEIEPVRERLLDGMPLDWNAWHLEQWVFTNYRQLFNGTPDLVLAWLSETDWNKVMESMR